jgi:hypothetical protein
MPRAYTRKYQKELDDLLYFLMEYPELNHLLTPERREKVEKRRQELVDWLWRQTGRKDDPPVLKPSEFGDEVGFPPIEPADGRTILRLYEKWRASETGRNPRKRRADDQKNADHKIEPFDIPF